MKFIKTFESYNGGANDSSDTEKKLSAKINAMNDEQLAAAQEGLNTLAKKLGLAPEDLTDVKKVEAAIKKKPLALAECEINEGLSEWWSRVKTTVFSWMTKLGITGIISSIVTLGVGSEMMDQTAAEFTGGTVTPNATIVIGAVALVISLAATIIGGKLSKN